MKLNADIGEGFGSWRMGDDANLMPLIDQANIACGYHAGDAVTMQKTISLAKACNVEIGAHVSYPDLQGFGRRSMAIPKYELVAMIQSQIATLDGLAKCQNTKVAYVKPHGALYNDMMSNNEIMETVFEAVSGFYQPLQLMVQGLTDNIMAESLSRKYHVSILFEAFSDRAYQDNGLLVSRQKPHAVLTQKDAFEHCKSLIQNHTVISENKVSLSLTANTLCVHGDNADSFMLCKQLREWLSK